MKALMGYVVWVGLLALGASSPALANGDCGINSNKPCPPPKSSAKEPAYKSINSNTTTTQQATQASPRKSVKASEKEDATARATLPAINPNDLKLKPKPINTSQKEPANKP